jgi:molybdopterin converting factor small subunit
LQASVQVVIPATNRQVHLQAMWGGMLKITVESIGLPVLSAVLGKKTQIDLEGASLADLIDQVTRRFGPEAKQVLLNRDGKLDLSVQVMVNEEGFIAHDEFRGRLLKDGDRVRFMLLVCGG